jgi:hypothetical protein
MDSGVMMQKLSVMREGSEPETNFVLVTGGQRYDGGVVDLGARLRGRAVVASTPPGPSLQRLTHRHWRQLMLLDSFHATTLLRSCPSRLSENPWDGRAGFTTPPVKVHIYNDILGDAPARQAVACCSLVSSPQLPGAVTKKTRANSLAMVPEG